MILVDVSSEKIILGGLLVNYRSHVGQLLIIDMLTDILACERRRISGCRFTPPRNNVCENEPRKNFRDVKAFVLLLANKIPW